MPNTFLIPDDGDLLRSAPAQTVYTRGTWEADWTERPHLFATRAYWGTGPVRSQAEIGYRFGDGIQPGQATFSLYDRHDLSGHYVKIKIDQGTGEDKIFWYGVLTDNAIRRDGAFLEGGFRQGSGKQILAAEGLEHFLLRTFVTSAIIENGPADWPYRIERGLVFNDPKGYQGVGNRSTGHRPGAAFVFAANPAQAAWWSSRDIVEYLMTCHPPVDHQGDGRIDWRLTDRAKTCLPDWDRPVVQTQNRSLFSIINELCDRRQMLSWRVTVEAEGATPNSWKQVYVDVFCFNAEDIELPNDKVQAANPNLVTLDFDRAVDVVQCVQRQAEQHRVEQVVIRGARKRAVGSWSFRDDSLAEDWDVEDDQQDYETLPAAISALTDPSEKQNRMAAYRSEDRLARVFSWFRVPADWDGRVGDGQGGEKSFLSTVGELGNLSVTWYVPELRLERFLPAELSQETAPAEGTQQLPPPIALIKVENDKYEHVENLAPAGAGQEGVGHGDGRHWSCSLRVQPDVPGVVLKVSDAKPAEGQGQHNLAWYDFQPISEINDQLGDLDWRDVIVTAMVELDEYLEIEYPASDQLALPLDVARVVYVDLGDAARLDWVHAAAVRGVLDGVLQYEMGATPASDGQWVRDDRTKMRALARFLFEFYGIARQAMTLELQQLSGMVGTGDLITRIGTGDPGTEEEVNALVTGVTMDFIGGRTTFTTGFAKLDPIRLFNAE